MNPLRARRVPALRLALVLVCGILCGTVVTVPPGLLLPLAFFLLAVLVLLGALAVRSASGSPFRSVLTVFVCLLSGILKINADRSGACPVPPSLFGSRTVVAGRILDPPTSVGKRTRFTLAVDRAASSAGDARVRELAAVVVVRSVRDTLPPVLEYGAYVVLRGELTRPPEERNPGEFSARQYYEANGITLALFVRGYSAVTVIDTTGGSWIMRRVVVPARRFVLKEIDRTVGGEEGEFLKGLVIGERSGIPVSTRQAFVNAGVAHVLAVSGSNVAVVGAVLLFLFGMLRLPRSLGSVAVAAGLLFYMMLTGNQPPVVRATVMAWVFLLGRVLQRKNNAYNALGCSVLLILGWDARQLFDIGFQLSYGAVFSILFFYPLMNRWIFMLVGKSRVMRGLAWLLRVSAVSVAATLGTLPLTAVAFGRVSVIGILANIVVIPATSVSVVLGCASSVAAIFYPWLASVYAAANSVVLHWTLRVTEIAGGLPCAYIDTVTFRSIDSLPYYAVLAFCVALSNPPLARRLLVGMLLAFDIALFWPERIAVSRTPGLLRVTVIDVGEGDAILVEFPRGETMLIDSGPISATGNAAEQIVLPFLRRKGIAAIDLLLVSHPHADHLGGVPYVLRNVRVSRVADSGQWEPTGLFSAYLNEAKNQEAIRAVLQRGDRVELGHGARLYVLAPEPTFLVRDSTAQHVNLNNSSVVVRLMYGSVSFLFTGDAEREVERALVARYGDFLRSDLLKIAHHGSSTGTGDALLSAVHPVIGVISVGRNNTFRHPSASVLRRCDADGIVVVRTDDDGALMYETDGRELRAVSWR